MTPDQIRSEAILRVAKAELGVLLGWPESLDEAWDSTPEEKRERLIAAGVRAVDAIGDLLATEQPTCLGYAVLLKREPSDEPRLGAYDIHDSSFDEREAAEQSAVFWWSEADTCNVPVEYVVAELRAVKP